MNARIPQPDVADSDFGAFEAAQATLERPADKARALAHYLPMAAAAQRGPQHQIQIQRGDPIVGVPYRGEVWDVACEVEPADHRHARDGYTIYAVKLNDIWFSSDWLAPCLSEALQRTLDAMPRNT